jgi:hypothetical protein
MHAPSVAATIGVIDVLQSASATTASKKRKLKAKPTSATILSARPRSVDMALSPDGCPGNPLQERPLSMPVPVVIAVEILALARKSAIRHGVAGAKRTSDGA